MGPISRFIAPAGLAAFAACADADITKGLSPYQRTAETWVGARAAELQDAWGEWNRTRDLGGGARQLIYSVSQTAAGLEVGCEARFSVSPEGTITGAHVSGTVGGCRQMLAHVPRRGQ